MKKLFFSFLVSIVGLLGADWYLYHNYDEGATIAKKENKPMMIMIHTAGCPECKYMEEVVFKDEETNKFLRENFVAIAVDFKTDKYPKKFIHFGVPHIYFTDKEGNVIDQQIGGSRGDKFLKKLQAVKAKI